MKKFLELRAIEAAIYLLAYLIILPPVREYQYGTFVGVFLSGILFSFIQFLITYAPFMVIGFVGILGFLFVWTVIQLLSGKKEKDLDNKTGIGCGFLLSLAVFMPIDIILMATIAYLLPHIIFFAPQFTFIQAIIMAICLELIELPDAIKQISKVAEQYKKKEQK